MNIAVGSTNPVKIAAARAIFRRIEPNLTITGVAVESGVPAQPWGHEQTRQGAVNRARAVLADNMDYGIGFEGGIIETEYGLMTCAWCAVVDRAGRIGLGGGVNVLLPPAIQRAVEAGSELGSALDALVGLNDTKQGPGAVGILTEDLVDRQQAYEQILALALAPFRRPDLYQDNEHQP